MVIGAPSRRGEREQAEEVLRSMQAGVAPDTVTFSSMIVASPEVQKPLASGRVANPNPEPNPDPDPDQVQKPRKRPNGSARCRRRARLQPAVLQQGDRLVRALAAAGARRGVAGQDRERQHGAQPALLLHVRRRDANGAAGRRAPANELLLSYS